jgi:hypothetical protein
MNKNINLKELRTLIAVLFVCVKSMLFWSMVRNAYKVLKQFGLIQTPGGKELAMPGQIPDVVFRVISAEKSTYYDFEGEGVELSPITTALLKDGAIRLMWTKSFKRSRKPGIYVS